MKISDIEKRILEINTVLHDEKREKSLASGLVMRSFLGKLEKENKPLLSELDELKQKLQFAKEKRNFKVQFILALSTIISTSISLLVFKNNIDTNKLLNRPYISIDASKMSKQLAIFHGDPNVNPENLLVGGVSYNNSFNFTIQNIGRLPARYKVDTSNFKRDGLKNVWSPVNAVGVIFPNQIIVIDYDLEGVLNSTSSSAESKRILSLSKGGASMAGEIVVNYGYLNEGELVYKTNVEEKTVQSNCGEQPTPGLSCFPNPEWITNKAN